MSPGSGKQFPPTAPSLKEPCLRRSATPTGSLQKRHGQTRRVSHAPARSWSVRHSEWSRRTSSTRQSAVRPPQHSCTMRPSSVRKASSRARRCSTCLNCLRAMASASSQGRSGWSLRSRSSRIAPREKPSCRAWRMNDRRSRAARLGHQPDLLVVENRLHLGSGLLRQTADRKQFRLHDASVLAGLNGWIGIFKAASQTRENTARRGKGV